MGKKSTVSTSNEITLSQKQLFIPKINRLIHKLNQIDVDSIMTRNDARITIADTEIEGLLQDIFGANDVRYQGYSHITPLDAAPINVLYATPIADVRSTISERIAGAITALQSIKQDLEYEVQSSSPNDKSRAQEAYDDLQLHPRIAAVANPLYKDGHFSQAVQEAAKALVLYVKEKSGVTNDDGSSLMQHVFSPKKPILKFNSLANQSEIDEQQGFMFLFAGAVLGIRNPRAHEHIVDEPERALEFIGFISLLAKYVDIAQL